MTDTELTDEQLDELLDAAELPEDTVKLCLRTSLQREFEAAEQRLADALQVNDDTDSLGGGPADIETLAADVERIRQQMAAAVVPFRFRALDKTLWPLLIAEHPAREGNEQDAQYGMNFDAFFTALIKKSTVKPAMTPARWDKLLSKITDGQWGTLTAALWALNRSQGPSVPFSAAASRILRNSAAASKRPTDSDSL